MLNHNQVIAAALNLPRQFGEEQTAIATSGTKAFVVRGKYGDVQIEVPEEAAQALVWNILDFVLEASTGSLKAGAILGDVIFNDTGELTPRAYTAAVHTVAELADNLISFA